MKKSLIAVLSALALAVCTMPGTADAATVASNGRLTVSATGSVSVKRDKATFTLSASALEPSAKAAMASATRTFNTVRDAVLAAGAKQEDLVTAGLSLSPEYDYSSNRAVLTGYRASVSLSVTTSLGATAAVIDAAVETGGDAVTLSGISFDVSNTEEVTATARARAVAAARAKAQAYARLLGAHLGKPVKVVETSAPVSYPVYATADKVGGINLDAGSSKVSVSVEITYQIG